MTVDYTAARTLFLAVLDAPSAERDGLLEERCAGDEELLAEVRSLLAFHEDEPGDQLGYAPLQTGDRYANRYRILRRLGQGGMGDVYHALDEVLEEPVALKRLLGRDDSLKEALLNEVRLARRVTHPRICRVHDVGEWRGDRFITMEFIDGEDLGKVLQRVGRLPPERVVAMAGELCVGLAAAHGKGVLHRDLKPANILVDPDGHVHITDFGIAARTGALAAAAVTGTPSYMAPEQLVPGAISTERSDIYALGLVLHEMLTGRPVFTGAGVTEVLVSRREVAPRSPSETVTDVPPELDEAVRRALRADPLERPASALEFAGLLPGGDALRTAVEANTTPSPGLIARASIRQATPPSASPLPAFAALLVILTGTIGLADSLALFPIAATAPHPEVSVQRAVDLARQFGYAAGDGARSFHGYIRDPTVPAGEPAHLFWYREDRAPHRTAFQRAVLDPTAALSLFGSTTLVEPDRLIAVFDAAGRLAYFQGPVDDSTAGPAPGPADWDRLLTTAGLDRAQLTPTAPELPTLFATERAAWLGTGARAADSIRVDAAAIDGRLVYYAAGRDTGRSGGRIVPPPPPERGLFAILFLVPVFIVAGVLLLVRNVRARRFDGSGTIKVVGVVSALALVRWLLIVDHVDHPLAVYSAVLTSSFRTVPLLAFGAALFYLALEPTVRHAWPHTLLAWTRVLHRDGLNPLVGRSILVGAVAGALCALIYVADLAIPGAIGVPASPGIDHGPRLLAALGVREMTSLIFGNAASAIVRGIIVLFAFTALRRWLRRPALAATAFVLLVAVLEGGVGAHHDYSIVTLGVPIGIVTAVVLSRTGLLAYVVCGFAYSSLRFAPLTLDTGTWWAWSGFAAVAIVVSVGAAGAWMCRHRPAAGGWATQAA